MDCKDCKYWKRETFLTKKGIDITNEKEFGKISDVITLNNKPDFDKTKFVIIENNLDYGVCENRKVQEMINAGTNYGDGLTFDEKFGCIMFENKEI